MTVIEKLFALKRNRSFRHLHDSDLILIAEIAVPRQFEPGSTVAEAGTLPNRLLIVAKGSVHPDSTDASSGSGPENRVSVIGIDALALEREFDQSFVAGSEGATCLMISKGHFFTIINECPAILTEHLQQSGGPNG